MTDQPIRAVIFDMDGVLTDSEPLINAAAVEMFREKGLAVRPEDFLPFVGTGENRYIGGVAEAYGFALDVPAAKRRTYELYLQMVPDKLEAFPGAADLVRTCRQAGLRTAVASSADRIKIKANLEKIGLPLEAWEAVVTGEDVTARKPAPDIFLQAAAKLNLAPGECVVVEDAVNGVAAAKAAGMRCVAVAQSFPAGQLAQADVVREKISEVGLPELLGQSETPPFIGPEPPVLGPESPSGPGTATPRKQGPWGFWATLGFMLLIGVAFTFMQVMAAGTLWAVSSALGYRLPAGWESQGLVLGLATCASTPVAVFLAGLFAWMRRTMPVREYLGLLPVSGLTLLKWSLALLVMAGLSDALTVALGRPIVPQVMRETYQSAVFPPLLWFAVVVMAPIAEETLFRGFLFTGLQRSWLGTVGAILLTSLAWSAIHVQYDWYGVATVFAAGLLFGYARSRTGSVYVTTWMHSLMNLVATAEAAFATRG